MERTFDEVVQQYGEDRLVKIVEMWERDRNYRKDYNKKRNELVKEVMKAHRERNK